MGISFFFKKRFSPFELSFAMKFQRRHWLEDFAGKPRSASEGRLQLDGGFLKNEAIHSYKNKSNCQIEPMKITLPSHCEATHFAWRVERVTQKLRLSSVSFLSVYLFSVVQGPSARLFQYFKLYFRQKLSRKI